MTTPLESAPPSLRRRYGRSRRLSVLGAIAVALLVSGLTVAFTLRHLDHQYGPMQSASFWGPQTDRGLTISKDGFSYRLADQPGATARFITGLDNLGVHSVKVTSIDADDIATDIRWSEYRVVNGGTVSGEGTLWHRFPAIVPAHGTIRLLITIHHPADCAASKNDGVSTATSYTADHRVHWQSLLHSHTTLVQFDSDPTNGGIRVC